MKQERKKGYRLTIRVSPRQYQVLTELKDGLNTSFSMLIRSMILDFITHNEETLERIIIDKTIKK